MTAHFNWTAERLEQLRRLAAQHMSSREIAEAMGIKNRANIIRVCQRKGITLLCKGTLPPRELPRPAKPAVPPKRTFAPASASPINLIDAKDNHCRFVIGDARAMQCCGDHVHNVGDSYCRLHMAVVYQHPHARALRNPV